ncbi:MAG: hypothetical protein FWE70_07170 [Oscillospiraceae bacterium]|nr:hypothetical protein [Oscillospiraceae bacterium]
MTGARRFVDCVLGRPTDRGVLWADGLWGETLERWRREGMAEGHDFGYDFSESDTRAGIPLDYGYIPPFETRVLEDMGDKQRIVDVYGVEKIVMKGNRNLQQFIRYPVACRDDWERLNKRLAPDAPGRFGDGWREGARKAAAKGAAPTTIGGGHLCGFFSFLREAMGDGCYYMMHDDEGLIRDMLSFQANRIKRLIREATSAARIDRLFIWEDMCYKNGPLIGPAMFRSFLSEHYADVCGVARSCGIPVVDVDSDGRIDALIPLWAEAGVNLMHPFEAQSGMDVNRVRREFGYGFAMRGGVDKRMLAQGRRAIEMELDRVRPAYEAGRYIPHVDHTVPPDVSFNDYCHYLDGLKRLINY